MFPNRPTNALDLLLLSCTSAAMCAHSTAAAAATPAPATVSTGNPAACAELSDDHARLACYDLAVGRTSAGAPATLSPPKETASAQLPQTSAADRAVTTGMDADSRAPSDASAASVAAVSGNGLTLPTPAESAPSDKRSLSARWELDAADKRGTFNLRPYKLNYLLPVRWSSSPNTLPASPNPNNRVGQPLDLENIEAKFQISFKTKLTEGLFGKYGDLWAGYTQQSNWQLYSNSAPFRDTIYEPEILSVFRSNLHLGGGLRLRMLSLALNHQSNGRGLPQSRSWNRLIGTAGFEYGNFQLIGRAWQILGRGSLLNDNPDIAHYLGRGDLQARWYAGEHALSITARGPLLHKHSRGALLAEWNFPIHRNFKGYLQASSGYGETLLDYNHRQTTFGLGISIVDWQ